MIEILKSKLQKVKVTESEYSYKGSIGIDKDLMSKLDIWPYEKCIINGKENRNDITYVIPRESGTGTISINGALSTRHKVGDEIHVLFFKQTSFPELNKPKIVITDSENKFVKCKQPTPKGGGL